jgi:hypothetical protein
VTDVVSFEGPPEFYSDSASVGLNPFGVVITFGLITDSPGSQRTQVVVRMSPQHALALTQVLRNHLRKYQEQVGPIPLPAEMRRELGLDEDVL